MQVVFAVDDPVSLDEAKGIIEEIRTGNTKRAPILLVANKIDLYGDEEQWACKGSRLYAVSNKLHFAAVSATDAHQVITFLCFLEKYLHPQIALGVEHGLEARF